MEERPKTAFATVNGARFFTVSCGKAKVKAYSAGEGQEEVFRNDDLSLHTLPKEGDWIGCRLYLVGGRRRKVWHFGVNDRERRVSRVTDTAQMEAEFPGLLSWARDFVLGSRYAPPSIRAREAARRPTREEYDRAVGLIEASAADGVGWSYAANTRRRGRYYIDNLRRAMPATPAAVIDEIAHQLLLLDVVRSIEIDKNKHRFCLMVFRDALKAAREAGRLGGDEEGEGRG